MGSFEGPGVPTEQVFKRYLTVGFRSDNEERKKSYKADIINLLCTKIVHGGNYRATVVPTERSIGTNFL